MAREAPRGRVFFRSLGCPKNQVDSEVMLGSLAQASFAIAERLEDADIAIVNTCSFIGSAREESVAVILELGEARSAGRLRALLVTGCLPQRYGRDLERELPEVDAFVGTADFPGIDRILERALRGEGRGVYVDAGRTYLAQDHDARLLIGPRHSAYLKIAEGCDRVCAFCAIPGIRGRFQSRPIESLVREAERLAGEGVRELNLISQDTTSYGKDVYGSPRLVELLEALDGVSGLDWIRLLYLYPSAVNDALIRTLAGAKRILPYVDMPLQHASDSVLRAMRRGVTAARQSRLVARLRDALPDLALRTTLIVGFPGESDEDFERLLDFVRETRFDRLGAFQYSDEEGTSAHALLAKVPRKIARARQRRLLAVARAIHTEKLEAQVGQEAEVLIDRSAPGLAQGRIWSQAPEIDGHVVLRRKLEPGTFVRARLCGVRDVDLEAEPLDGDAAA